MINVDEVLEIDQLVLRDYQADGHREIDVATHRAAIVASKARSTYAVLRRTGRIAHMVISGPLNVGLGSSGGNALHPDQRNPSVMRKLAKRLNDLISGRGILASR